MDINDIKPENVEQVTIPQLDSLLRTVFSDEEWTNMTTLQILHHRNVLVAYLKSADLRNNYTLNEFMRIERDQLMTHPVGETPSEHSSSGSMFQFDNSSSSSSSPPEDLLNESISDERADERHEMDLAALLADPDIELDPGFLQQIEVREPTPETRKRRRTDAMATYRVPHTSRRSSLQSGSTSGQHAGPSTEPTPTDQDAGPSTGPTTTNQDAGPSTGPTTTNQDAGPSTGPTTTNQDAGPSTEPGTTSQDDNDEVQAPPESKKPKNE